MKLNAHYDNLKESYLFATVANKTAVYTKEHPDKKIIRMGIGDVTRPLPYAVVEAGVKAARELGDAATFRGYGPYEGYEFLRQAIADYYGARGVKLGLDEIFVSEGAKSDVGGILDIFDKDNTVLVPDPVYPVYVDSNVMDGRKIVFTHGDRENGFLPLPDEKVECDLIYLCSPNNPTGAVYDKAGLKTWVNYANKIGAVILFDAAYEFFISDPDLPHSIYEIEGADTCAIEMCSLSKTAGFTGTRCGYMIIPKKLGKCNAMWLRRQSTKFNGVSYVVQRMAEAVFSAQGVAECAENVAYYKRNTAVMAETFSKLGMWFTGGVNSPYIWLSCGGDSWKFFDKLLSEANVVGTPGAGFGACGEGYFRLTGFGKYEDTVEAMARIAKIL